ncbi:MAG: RimK family alpha-L-glutamate ligase [Pseudomonadota bacterium]
MGRGEPNAARPAPADGSPGEGTGQEVWILQRHKNPQQALKNENTARLADALLRYGMTPRVVSPQHVGQSRGPGHLRIKQTPVAVPAALIGRSGANTGAEARALGAMLEGAGTAAFPTARALALVGDKLSAGRWLRAAGLPVPDFREIGPGVDAQALGKVLGWPLVVKAGRGSKGRSVRLVDGPEALAQAVSDLIGQGPLIAQRFVAESRGRDIRVIVIGGTAIGAMAREASGPNDFRSNIAAGGRGRAIPLCPEIAQLAEAAARTADLGIAGVDLLHEGSGFTLCELNTAPGFVAFEAVTGIDVAAAIAGHVAARVAETQGARSC